MRLYFRLFVRMKINERSLKRSIPIFSFKKYLQKHFSISSNIEHPKPWNRDDVTRVKSSRVVGVNNGQKNSETVWPTWLM